MIAIENRVHTTDIVAVTRPNNFDFNSEAAKTNPFMHRLSARALKAVRRSVLAEHDGLRQRLTDAGIGVHELPNKPGEPNPDDQFLNNIDSHHQSLDGRSTVVFYPVSPGRQRERQKSGVLTLLDKIGIGDPHIVDLSHYESQGKYLEGTGSLVLANDARLAIAVASSRTDRVVAKEWARRLRYKLIFCNPNPDSPREMPIYHTNVIGSIGEGTDRYGQTPGLAVFGLQEIAEPDRPRLIDALEEAGRDVMEISPEQVDRFGGNIIWLRGANNIPHIFMSYTALDSYSKDQRKLLEAHGNIVPVPFGITEFYSGGGVRCAIKQIFPRIEIFSASIVQQPLGGSRAA